MTSRANSSNNRVRNGDSYIGDEEILKSRNNSYLHCRIALDNIISQL